MDFRQLQYFIAVAEDLHFGQAAERLQITQPALSKQIAGLEKMLGVQLLFRTKRTVALTPAGQTFLQQARQLLTQKEAAIQLTRRTGCGEIGHLSIGFTPRAINTVLPPLLRDFWQHYPKVDINLIELSTDVQVKALNQNTIDLGFLHPPIDQRRLQLYPIFEESIVAVLPPDHALASYDTIPLKALAHVPLIIPPPQVGSILYGRFLQICQKAGFQPQIVKESFSLDVRLCFVSAGLGITFIPEHFQFRVGNHLVCRPLDDLPLYLKFGAAWRKESINPALRNLLKIMFAQIPMHTPLELD